MFQIKFCSTSCETALRWVPQNTFDDVNIDSGNGLVLSGNKLLSELMVTQLYVAICHHYASTKVHHTYHASLY